MCVQQHLWNEGGPTPSPLPWRLLSWEPQSTENSPAVQPRVQEGMVHRFWNKLPRTCRTRILPRRVLPAEPGSLANGLETPAGFSLYDL